MIVSRLLSVTIYCGMCYHNIHVVRCTSGIFYALSIFFVSVKRVSFYRIYFYLLSVCVTSLVTFPSARVVPLPLVRK